MADTPFAPWHDFYTLTGAASATLVGLMFVAASVGTEVFTQERQVGLRTFLSPTVVAFSAVFATSIVGVLPPSPLWVPSLLLLAIGLFGVGYSWVVWQRMVAGGIATKIDLEDRAFYALAPAAGYAVVASGGGVIPGGSDVGCILMAIGACLLLLAGIRNAWDMTTWIVLRPRQ